MTTQDANVFTEFAGGILDSYHAKVSQAEAEIDLHRSRADSFEYDYRSMTEDRDRFKTEAESQKKHAERNETISSRLRDQLADKATEIAKKEKVIEQYAAWRVAVREALADIPARFMEIYGPDETAQNVAKVLERISQITAKDDSE